MTMARLACVIALLAVCYCQYAYSCGSFGIPAHYSDRVVFIDLPCPNPEDIAPCGCTYNSTGDYMDMDCGEVNGTVMYDVFHSPIPFPKFRQLSFAGADDWHILKDTVFGNATFEIVRANYGQLQTIGPKTFIKSVSTLSTLDFRYNQLTEIPTDLTEYKVLGELDLTGNGLLKFPVLKSESLETVILGDQAWSEIPEGALDGLPNLTVLSLILNQIDSMAEGVFMQLTKLQTIDITFSTGLENLHKQQFTFNSPNITYIILQNNQIKTVDADTFKGVPAGCIIELWNNNLTLLPEATWKPLMNAGVNLKLDGNDLTCGCDIAWMVLDVPKYKDLVDNATCHSGVGLYDLDPNWFQHFCRS